LLVYDPRDIEISFTDQWMNNGNLFIRAGDCDLTTFFGTDPDVPILKTTAIFIHPLADPLDYHYVSANLSEGGSGISFTRPIFTMSFNTGGAVDEIYSGIHTAPNELKAAHKLTLNRAKKESARDGPKGRIPTYTTFYRFPEGFVGSHQYYSDGRASKGELCPIPIHKDVTGEFGWHVKGAQAEPITEATIFAVAFLFVEKDDKDEEPSTTAATNDLARDFERKLRARD
jgi:hypothetical protein